MGTYVARSYGIANTGLQFSPAEKMRFARIGTIYPMISYPLGLLLSLLIIGPIVIAFQKRRHLKFDFSPDALEKMRAHSLKMPVFY